MQDKILILDFGSQYTQLIARRVRECGVYSEIMAWDTDADAIRDFSPNGIILSGGPETVTGHDAPTLPDAVFSIDVPVLGICYGMQAMAAYFDGDVQASSQREFGHAAIKVEAGEHLLAGLADADDAGLDVWMSHGDKVTRLPEQFSLMASTDSAPIAAMFHRERPIYGLQFHPEVTHTQCGHDIVQRFVRDICACQGLWTIANIAEDAIQNVRETVGDDQVILGLSGGVDSSVVAALLHRAIGDQLTCVFVDNGLLRLDEGDQVMAMFAEHMGVRVIRVDAEQRFLDVLEGIADPEQKRKRIGNTFIHVFDEEAAKIKDANWLAQGTIYPDVIESAASKHGKAHVIKSHHNVGGLPDKLNLKIVEPLRMLFKDEVMQVYLHRRSRQVVSIWLFNYGKPCRSLRVRHNSNLNSSRVCLGFCMLFPYPEGIKNTRKLAYHY